MTKPAIKLTAVPEDLVRLRDEIAMHALNGLLINGQWGFNDKSGIRHIHTTAQEYSDQSYQIADEMLAARERI